MDFKLLENTPLYKAFSEVGKRIFLPEGIFYWSGRAKNEAELIGTIGSAFGYEKDFIEDGEDKWVPCYLKEIKKYSNLNVEQIVPYASIGGLPELRKIWKDWIIEKARFNSGEDKKNIDYLTKYITDPLVTAGVTNGIYLVCSLFLNKGEKIICPNKRWGNYDNIIVKNIGAQIESFEFFRNKKINLDGLRKAIQELDRVQDKIVIILNFPNNPTGYVPTKQEALDLINLLQQLQLEIKKPFIILVDDAYEPYIYNFREDILDVSIFYQLQQLEEEIIPIKLDGITKELLFYGGRIGFVTIGLKPIWVQDKYSLSTLKDEINNKLEGFNRSSISNSNHFYQTVAIKLFQDSGKEKIIESRNKVKLLLEKRCKKINQELMKIKSTDISVDPNSGGFFIFVNLNPEKIKASEFADYLLTQHKVGVIPIENPRENINGIRIAYSSINLDQIPEFIERIKKALSNY